ncbi:ABC transporter substrate-binding protein [Variovorax guangxiensis]|uniref:ABC transporter substrate-binding protein n=1 Tax=Variovorax guangxiensis TaxID=1775474 RepID=UPI00285B3259|nr:ABC-type branched-subunit amino acid transport system substrate-binding protein [Variovorax guangxiensis]
MDLRRRRTALQMGAALAASQHAAPLVAQTKRPATHEILVGQAAAVTGPFFASSSLDFNRGVNAHFAEVNAKGGVDGRKLRFISLDDGYDAEKAKADFKQLVEVHGVFALLGIGGTPANLTLSPFLAEARVPHIGPISGADVLRTPPPTPMCSAPGPATATRWRGWWSSWPIGQRKVVILHSANAIGKSVAAGFGRLAKARGLEVTPITLGEGAAELSSALQAWVRAHPMLSYGCSRTPGPTASKRSSSSTPRAPARRTTPSHCWPCRLHWPNSARRRRT